MIFQGSYIHNHPRRRQSAAASIHNNTSTPSRRSAPNLSAMLADLDASTNNNGNGSNAASDDMTAELDLSDPPSYLDKSGNNGGLALNGSDVMTTIPLEDSRENTPMFLPRSSSRVVRIISKQSNV